MSTTLEAALRWYDAGYLPIPIPYAKKRPALVKWTRYRDAHERPSRELVKSWFSRGRVNVALICGAGAPGGLVCLDFDDNLSFWHWRCKYPYRTTTTKSARGWHVFFRVRDIDTSINTASGGIFEVKTHSYVVDYPSLHESGVYYEQWLGVEPMTVDRIEDVCVPDVASRDRQGATRPEIGMCVCPSATVDSTAADTHTHTHLGCALAHPLSRRRGKRWVDFAEVRKQASIRAVLDDYDPKPSSSSDGDYYTCHCPFHGSDDHYSFWLHEGTGMCGCFKPGCAKSMNVIALVARLQNVSYRDAAIALKDW